MYRLPTASIPLRLPPSHVMHGGDGQFKCQHDAHLSNPQEEWGYDMNLLGPTALDHHLF